MRWYLVMLVGLLLAACDSGAGIPSVNSRTTSILDTPVSAVSSSPSSATTDTPVQRTPVSTASVPTATVIQETQVLSDGWSRIRWEGVSIAIPPQGQWQPNVPLNAQFQDTKVLSTGQITYPASIGTVEGLNGPTFAILSFTGSLTDWLQVEKRRNLPGNPVDDQTIRYPTLAGTQAVAYQRAVKGVGTTEYYALKLNQNRLLWIMTENTESQLYQRVLDRLMVETSG